MSYSLPFVLRFGTSAHLNLAKYRRRRRLDFGETLILVGCCCRMRVDRLLSACIHTCIYTLLLLLSQDSSGYTG